MKNVLKILSILFMAILFSSCLQSGVDLTVNKDGSGELVQTFRIQKEYIPFLNSGKEGEANTDPNLIDRDQLEKLAAAMGEGVTLSRIEPAAENDPYGGYKAYFSFPDITKLRTSSSPMTTPGEEADNSEWITYRFSKGNRAVLTVITPFDKEDDTNASADENQTDSEQPQSDEEKAQMEQMKQIYRTMHFWFKIHVNGTITDTNARYSEKSDVIIMDLLFDKIVENDKLFREMTDQNGGNNLEKMRSDLEKAGVKMDDTEEIKISFL